MTAERRWLRWEVACPVCGEPVDVYTNAVVLFRPWANLLDYWSCARGHYGTMQAGTDEAETPALGDAVRDEDIDPVSVGRETIETCAVLLPLLGDLGEDVDTPRLQLVTTNREDLDG